jgi:steroid delta-isomerase-like uncharacterized protein
MVLIDLKTVLDSMNGERHAFAMEDTKIPIIRRYFAELFNQGRLQLVPELLHPQYVNHSPGSPDLPRGRDGVALVVQALRRGMPDLRYDIDEMVVGEDAVAVRATLTGTHDGDLFGMAPTGKRLEVKQMTFERFLDGRIVAHHRLTDELSMLRQLGVLPTA